MWTLPDALWGPLTRLLVPPPGASSWELGNLCLASSASPRGIFFASFMLRQVQSALNEMLPIIPSDLSVLGPNFKMPHAIIVALIIKGD